MTLPWGLPWKFSISGRSCRAARQWPGPRSSSSIPSQRPYGSRVIQSRIASPPEGSGVARSLTSPPSFRKRRSSLDHPHRLPLAPRKRLRRRDHDLGAQQEHGPQPLADPLAQGAELGMTGLEAAPAPDQRLGGLDVNLEPREALAPVDDELVVGGEVREAEKRRFHLGRIDVEAPARLGALDGDSGSDDLREPVEVDRGEPEQRLDLPAHLLRPRLGAEETVPEPEPTRVGPLLPEALADVEGERRRAREPLG